MNRKAAGALQIVPMLPYIMQLEKKLHLLGTVCIQIVDMSEGENFEFVLLNFNF